MTSSRFPGKVLAPLLGRPLISHVLMRACAVAGARNVILLTSKESSDDPLALYAEKNLGVDVFRGELDNVLGRFQACLESARCDWFVRISGDSPVIDPELISLMLRQVRDDRDLITNVAARTFPPGQSVEIVRRSTFLALKAEDLDAQEREHVTLHYYRHPSRFRILDIRSVDAALASRRLVVDSIEDLEAMAAMLAQTPAVATGYADFVDLTH